MNTIRRAHPWRHALTAVGFALATSISFAVLAQGAVNESMGGSPSWGQTTAVQRETDTNQPSYGYGPGMIWEGYRPNTMYGYGPGMMENGYGPNVMRGCGSDRAWGGYGPGMRRGYGYYGPGVAGYWPGSGGQLSLSLSPKQRQKIGQLRAEHFREQQKLRVRLYEDLGRLRGLMATENPDVGAVGKAFDHLSATRKELFLNRLQMFEKMNKVLTPEQRQILQER